MARNITNIQNNNPVRKFDIHIKANTDEELKAALAEAAFILTGLSEAINHFDTTFGGPAAARKSEWKKKADEWKAKHKVYKTEP